MRLKIRCLVVMAALCLTGAAVEKSDAQQVASQAQRQGGGIQCYVVPAISNEKRLPDHLPRDGRLSNDLRVLTAPGESVPASFMIFAPQNIEAVQLTASDLIGEQGRIPAANVDIRVVKCWYQGGTAWHSYFADEERRSLVPELLLHDETLVKVDHDTRENYLRIDYPEGAEYRWVSYPGRIKGELSVFNHAREPVADSAELQPVSLEADHGKQFWITISVPRDAAAGRYVGTIAIATRDQSLGTMHLALQVLPFTLPEPRTYYDADQEFFAGLYSHTNLEVYAEFLGDDQAAAERKVLAEMKNLQAHNATALLIPRARRPDQFSRYARQFQLMRQAGMRTDPLFGFLYVYDWEMLYRDMVDGNHISQAKRAHVEQITEAQIALVEQELGHTNVYGIGWDEPGRATLENQQPLFEGLHAKGAQVYSTGKDTHMQYAGFNQDVINYPGNTFNAAAARKWHAMGAKIFSYAGPHTGPENPDYIRRTHGMMLYMADYDGSMNYRYYGYRKNIWNDFESESYRICFVYPTRNGVIDTLHWEGFREAINDIRYATKLRELAGKAIADGDVDRRYAGKKALQWLARLDPKVADLNAMRLEMINHILKIQDMLEGGEQ